MNNPPSQVLGGRKVAAYEAAIDEIVRQVVCPTCQAAPRRFCDWSWARPKLVHFSHVRRYDVAATAGLVAPLSTEICVKWQAAGVFAASKENK